MKKTNKKGFTIVELVIVIAVIAILAAVLIPTFSNVVKKANESAALQAARNEMTEYLASVNYVTTTPKTNYYIVVDTYAFQVTDGQLSPTPVETLTSTTADVLSNGTMASKTISVSSSVATVS